MHKKADIGCSCNGSSGRSIRQGRENNGGLRAGLYDGGASKRPCSEGKLGGRFALCRNKYSADVLAVLAYL